MARTNSASRRDFVLGATFSMVFGLNADSAASQQVLKEIHHLQPGEFTWHPERSSQGAVAVVVSLPEQRVHVYRNGIRIGVSTCSTGKPGHATPTGVFVILEKDKNHRSSTYNNAPMPNMNRLTWSGIALHAGNLPGYPASHGCVRLPVDFSAKLFAITHLGTPVIIAGSRSDPWELVHPGLFLGGAPVSTMEKAVAKLKGQKHPSDWPDGQKQTVVSVLASSADRTIRLIGNSREVAVSSLQIKGVQRLGEHVFTLRGLSGDDRALAWQGISHHHDPREPAAPEETVLQRLTVDASFAETLHANLHAGMLMVLTDLATSPDRQSGSDFVVMSDNDPPG